jgi:hypothetical protein
MRDDYLWDRSGPADAEVERLEQVLGRLRSRPAPPAWPEAVPHGPHDAVADRRPRASATASSAPAFLAAAAALIIACAAGLWTIHAHRPSWPVVRLSGTPVVGATKVPESGRLALGQWLETDARSRVSLAVADIGRVDVDAGTRLRLVTSRDGKHALALQRGAVHALIWAPPGQFLIETPSATAIDLGCEYTLRVDDSGAGLVEVITGWVGFEWDGREAFIPAGARCATRPGIGPGTPYFADLPNRSRAALEVIDFGSPREAERQAALAIVLAEARPRDAVTLWHLLTRLQASDSDAVFDTLARFVPPPPSVNREGIGRGDRVMLDAWWNALGLGTTDWWRAWKRPWR